MSDLIAFLNDRLGEDGIVARSNTGAGPGSQHGLGDTEDHGPDWPDYQTFDGPGLDAACKYLQQFRPLRMLREVAAKYTIIGTQTSDHAPIESIYGLTCRTCVDWHGDGGAAEFGIAIPHPWPCRVARAVAAAWSDHPDYDPAWATSQGHSPPSTDP